MTDPHHIDDEALSAHLDGMGGSDERAAVAAHLLDCAECAHRMDALADARGLLSDTQADPIDPSDRRRMIGRALEAASLSDFEPARAKPPWWQRPPVLAVAAAAAVALLVGAVAVFPDGGGEDDAAVESASGAGAVDSSVFAGDLGDFSDPDTIRDAVAARFAASSSGGGGAPAAGDDAEGGEPTEAAPDQGQTSEEGAPERTATPGDAVRGAGPTDGSTREGDLDDATRCLAETAAPDSSDLVLAATGEFQGTPAVVLAFRTGSTGRTLALILARSDCAILSGQSFNS